MTRTLIAAGAGAAVLLGGAVLSGQVPGLAPLSPAAARAASAFLTLMNQSVVVTLPPLAIPGGTPVGGAAAAPLQLSTSLGNAISLALQAVAGAANLKTSLGMGREELVGLLSLAQRWGQLS